MFARVPPIAIAGLVALVVIVIAVAVALATGGIVPHCTDSAGCATPSATASG